MAKWTETTGHTGKNQNYRRLRKQNWRKSAIIDYYRELTGNDALPADKQYWTMCNQCAEDGELVEDSELDQLLKAKLITSSQFYGIDIAPEIMVNNRTLDMEVGAWIEQDFYSAMTEADYNGTFNPAIINFDSTSMTLTNIEKFNGLLYFLQNRGYSNVLVVFNSIIRILHQGCKEEDFDRNINLVDELRKTTLGTHVLSDPKISQSPSCLIYRGGGGEGGRGNTLMGTVNIWRGE